ncbi:MAG TPA: hypothetical protein VFA60_01370 [Terriglobales bacterium]|nr:hypothetical protein [Terriglobales bacterium]
MPRILQARNAPSNRLGACADGNPDNFAFPPTSWDACVAQIASRRRLARRALGKLCQPGVNAV